MRLRYLVVLALVATGCSKPAVVTDATHVKKAVMESVAPMANQQAENKTKPDPAKPDKKTAPEKPADKTPSAVTKPDAPKLSAEEVKAAKELKEKLAAYEAEMAKADNAKARLAKAKDSFAALNEEFDAANKKYATARRKVRTREESVELMKTAPMKTMGPKFVEFAKKHKGTDEAYAAVRKIAAGGSDEAKTDAMQMLLEIAQAEPESKRAKAAFELLARSGSGDAKKVAMEKLLASAKSSSEASFNTLSTIAMAPGEDESKTAAINDLMAQIKADPKSKRSLDSLVKMAMIRGDSDAKNASIDLLVEHHVNNPALIKVMSTISRGLPSAQVEKWLIQISENSAGPVQANAVMNRISMIDNIKMYKTMLAEADEDMKKSFPAETQEFLNAERDADEMDSLDKLLSGYVKENSTLIEKAEKELFALRNLAIGKSAPEIAAKDLDGVSFKLSDYRGKVVLLDFWGDW